MPDDAAEGSCEGYSRTEDVFVNLNDSRMTAVEKFMDREQIQLALSVEAGAELVRLVIVITSRF